MDSQDLLKLLDLNAKPLTPPEEGTPTLSPNPTPAEPSSPTALQIDEWGLRRGLSVSRFAGEAVDADADLADGALPFVVEAGVEEQLLIRRG